MNSYLPEKLNSLLHASRTAIGSSGRGAALEDLVEHVFEGVPSVSLYARDVKDESGCQEVDLVFAHFFPISRLPILDVTIIIECKNERTKTSAAEVREFGSKLRTRSMNVGVLVTAAGLSGKRGVAGHSAIRDELSNGTSIIVVIAEELAHLRNPDDLVVLLTARLNELRTVRGYRSV